MMKDLKEKFVSDLKEALKKGDSLKIETLRLLLNAFHNKEIEKRTHQKPPLLDEEDILNILLSEAKKRKEAIELFEKGKRTDLAEKEKKELEIIEKYLPPPLSEKELEKIISQVIKETGAVSLKDFGEVMKEVMKKVKGRAEGLKVSQLIKEKLSA